MNNDCTQSDWPICDWCGGCLDPSAFNYNPNSCFDDGSCSFIGCIDEIACNYDSLANLDDGSCEYPTIGQITNPGCEICVETGNGNDIDIVVIWIGGEDCEQVNVKEERVTKKIISKSNIIGKQTNNNKGFQLHIYDDGSVEKKYLIK